MAYHEQHERRCPTCGERISATARKCFNCGEYVDDDEAGDDEEETTGHPHARLARVLGVIGALACVAVVIYVIVTGLAGSPQDAAGKQVQQFMEQKLGQKLNASSPLTLADVKDRLRRGMPIEEFDRIIAEPNRGPDHSTRVLSHVLVTGDPPQTDPTKQVRTYFLRDANLIVITESVGSEDEPREQIVSWGTEPVQTSGR
jgi:hypothetical protein